VGNKWGTVELGGGEGGGREGGREGRGGDDGMGTGNMRSEGIWFMRGFSRQLPPY